MIKFIHGVRPNLTVSDGDTMYSVAAAPLRVRRRADLSVIFDPRNLRATDPKCGAPISDIFDFDCGHGPATRRNRAAFPEAAIRSEAAARPAMVVSRLDPKP